MADKHEINETFKTANSLIYDFEKEARGDRECKRDIIGSKYSIPLNMISAKLKFLYYNHNGFSVYNANAYARLYNIVFDKNISILGNDLFTINFSRIDSFASALQAVNISRQMFCYQRILNLAKSVLIT